MKKLRFPSHGRAKIRCHGDMGCLLQCLKTMLYDNLIYSVFIFFVINEEYCPLFIPLYFDCFQSDADN